MAAKKITSLITLLGILSSISAITFAVITVMDFRDGAVHFTEALNNIETAAYIAVIAIPLCLVSLWLSKSESKSKSLLNSVGLLLALPLAFYIAYFDYAARAYPPINDITTDMDEPPSFWEVPNPIDYPGEHVASQQRQGYPDIKPLLLTLDAEHSFQLAADLAREKGWDVISEDDSELQIEAIATTALFGFEDYVAIRLEDVEGGTRVDMRSRSRLGQIDRGVNAKRIRDYLIQLEQRALSQ